MISLILPYWDRQAAADKALALLANTYRGAALEVVVVDDGNAVPFVAPPVDMDLTVVRLPEKPAPTVVSAPINAGVRASKHEIIALSHVETLHKKPILWELAAESERLGPKGYALAAVWCPEQSRWHCHSSVPVPDCPRGAGLAFCGVMRKSLFWEAGGLDERYCEGSCYEDRDFVLRLCAAGARFSIRDDLVATHPKTGARIKWNAAMVERNRLLFYETWGGARGAS